MVAELKYQDGWQSTTALQKRLKHTTVDKSSNQNIRPQRNSSADAQRDDTDTPTLIAHLFTELTVENQVKVLSQLFELYMSSHGLNVPEDFLIHAVNAMLQLKHNGRSNVLYRISGIIRERKCSRIGKVF